MRIIPFVGLSLALVLALASCKSQKNKLEFKTPESGTRVAFGDQVKLTLNFGSAAVDSVVYSVDGEVIERKTDTTSIVFDSNKFGFGDKSLSAKVYSEGKEDIAYSNVLVLPPNAKNYGFEVVNTFIHDEKASTQGLEFADGVLYESTGNAGGGITSLRKVDLATGRVIKKIEEPEDSFFGEGMTVVGNKIFFLTWLNKEGYIYDKESFKKIGTFKYENSKEGWGLTYDGKRLIKSDGSNKLYFLNAETGKEESSVSVFDENGAVEQLNELEYIDGKVYANVYQQEIIVIINPETGVVEGRINLVGMFTEGRQPNDNELNGIAYDKVGKRLFVTGKMWSKLFEIKLIER